MSAYGQPLDDVAAEAVARLGPATLDNLAAKYIWWKTPEQAARWPLRTIRQVMNLGTFDDMQSVAEKLGPDMLRNIVQTADAGEFNARSWHYWHYRLNMAKFEKVPPLPVRRFG